MKAIIAKKQTNKYRKPGLVWLKSRFFSLDRTRVTLN